MEELFVYALLYSEGDTGRFGKILMKSLRRIYEELSLEVFGRKMYSLWMKLLGRIGQEKPFFTFCYADDCLSYGDKAEREDWRRNA